MANDAVPTAAMTASSNVGLPSSIPPPSRSFQIMSEAPQINVPYLTAYEKKSRVIVFRYWSTYQCDHAIGSVHARVKIRRHAHKLTTTTATLRNSTINNPESPTAGNRIDMLSEMGKIVYVATMRHVLGHISVALSSSSKPAL
jgi:hypothetical protein